MLIKLITSNLYSSLKIKETWILAFRGDSESAGTKKRKNGRKKLLYITNFSCGFVLIS